MDAKTDIQTCHDSELTREECTAIRGLATGDIWLCEACGIENPKVMLEVADSIGKAKRRMFESGLTLEEEE